MGVPPVVPSTVLVSVVEHALVHALPGVGILAFNPARIIVSGNVRHHAVLDVCRDACLAVRISVPHVKMFALLPLEQRRHVKMDVLLPVCTDAIKIALQIAVLQCVALKERMHVMQIAA